MSDCSNAGLTVIAMRSVKMCRARNPSGGEGVVAFSSS